MLRSFLHALRTSYIPAFAWVFIVSCRTVPPLPPAARQLNEAGARALLEGDFAEAEAQLSLATEYSPSFTEAWTNLGMLELSRGNFELAKRHLERARDLNANLPAPHHGLGLVCERRDRYDDAVEHYRAALNVDPGFVPARVNLGAVLFRQRDYEHARAEFQKLTLHRPHEPSGWVGLVESLLKLGRLEEADRALSSASTSTGDHVEVRLLQARRAISAGDFTRAASLLEAVALEEDPSLASRAFAFLAVVHLAHAERARARHAIEEALTRDPECAIAKRLAALALP